LPPGARFKFTFTICDSATSSVKSTPCIAGTTRNHGSSEQGLPRNIKLPSPEKGLVTLVRRSGTDRNQQEVLNHQDSLFSFCLVIFLRSR
jgi:hypothetical protein